MPKEDFYATPGGNRPVINFIDNNCPEDVQAKIIAGMKDIIKYGTQLLYIKPGLIKPLGDKLFELKIYGESKWYRIIHAYPGNNIVVFLHAVIKKRNNLDPDDIKESKKRLKRYLEK